MNKEDIIRMARATGCHDNGEEFRFVELRYLERFFQAAYAAGAAAERKRIIAANAPEIEKVNAHIKALEDAVVSEREACAKVCEAYTDNDGGKFIDHEGHGYEIAAIIRARGESK